MAPSPTIRRLLKETSELSASSNNPNPAFHAAPVSDSDLHEWHFTLLGPPSPSPYAGGLYHGRISLPPSYPLKPPNFRFLTPSGRFEVNREICLSISGFHEETWMPAWGVRTALTALRSFMAEKGTAGQVGGLEAPHEVRERLARESRTWRCVECGGRTNEEVMREWWEACASKGVKVGEDVGLEILPEGLSLEAKIPGVAAGRGKSKEAGQDDQIASTPTQEVLHREGVSHEHDKQKSQVTHLPGADSQLPNAQPTSAKDSNSSPDGMTGLRPAALTPPAGSTDVTPSPPSRHQPTSSISSTTSNPVKRPSRSSLQTLPFVDPPQLSLQRQEEQNTVTIDRAIYIVFLALCIMVLKKVFYPATGGTDYEDYAMIKE